MIRITVALVEGNRQGMSYADALKAVKAKEREGIEIKELIPAPRTAFGKAPVPLPRASKQKGSNPTLPTAMTGPSREQPAQAFTPVREAENETARRSIQSGRVNSHKMGEGISPSHMPLS